MRRKWKARVTSGILSAAMIVTMLPATVFAAVPDGAALPEAITEATEDQKDLLDILEDNAGICLTDHIGQPDPDLSDNRAEEERAEETPEGPDFAFLDGAAAAMAAADVPTAMAAADVPAAMAVTDAQVSQPAGEGTAESPYQITNADELRWFAGLVNGTLEGVAQNTGACAKLMNDVDLGGTAETPWTPIGYIADENSESYYTGIFDGDSHSLNGLYVAVRKSRDTRVYLDGLFGVNMGTVKNLTVTNAVVDCGDLTQDNPQTTKCGAAIIAGGNGGEITGCRITGADTRVVAPVGAAAVAGANVGQIRDTSVETADVNGITYVGGIVAANSKDGALTNCTSGATVKGEYCAGGIVGENYGVIDGGVFSGTVETVAGIDDFELSVEGFYCGGIAGANYTGTLTGCETRREPEASEGESYIESLENAEIRGIAYVGGIAGFSGGIIDHCSNNMDVNGVQTDPALAVGEDGTAKYIGGIAGMSDWNPTQSDSEEIRTAGLVTGCNNYGIVGGGLGSQESGEEQFMGNGADIGGIVGRSWCSTIEDCTNQGWVIGRVDIGGIAGNVLSDAYEDGETIPSVIRNCKNESDSSQRLVITGAENMGGIAGYVADADVLIENCQNTGTVISIIDDSIGGIAGWNEGHIRNCVNGDPETTEELSLICYIGGPEVAGGIAGVNFDQGVVEGCDNYVYVGTGDFKDLVSDSTVFTENHYYAGGIVGVNAATVRDCQVMGECLVSAEYYAGGIAGGNFGTVDNCMVEEGVTVAGARYVGGIAGLNGQDPAEHKLEELEDPDYYTDHIPEEWPGLISGCTSGCEITEVLLDDWNEGPENLSCFFGGIAGVNEGQITNTDGTGMIEAESGLAAGVIAGCNSGTISDSMAEYSQVTAAFCAGGIVGANAAAGEITRCNIWNVHVKLEERPKDAADSDLTGGFAGGIAGANQGVITECESTSGDVDGTGMVGGVAGFNSGSIKDSSNSVAVTGTQMIGGIVGINTVAVDESEAGEGNESIIKQGEIVGCVNTAAVRVQVRDGVLLARVGGIVGINEDGAVRDCKNHGLIDGTDKGTMCLGGIVGLQTWYGTEAPSLLSGCENHGEVKGSVGVGGLVGDLDGGIVEKSSNDGDVSAIMEAGGVSGTIEGEDLYPSSVTDCYNLGTVNSVRGYAGGVSGYVDFRNRTAGSGAVKIANCYNVGEITSNKDMKESSIVAGILGAVEGNTVDDAVQLSACFYLEDCVDGAGVYGKEDVASGAYAANIVDFMDGHVVWALQASYPDTLVWGQKLVGNYDDFDVFPVLAQTEEERVVFVAWLTEEELLHEEYTNTGMTLADPEDEKDGYRLDGWYTDQEMTTKWNFETDTVGNQDMALFARWKPVLYGDADRNGVVDGADALMNLQVVVKLVQMDDARFDREAGDVDGDGEITAQDSLLILQKVVRLISRFPVEGEEEDPGKREPATVTVYATNDIHGVVSGDEASGTLGLPLVSGIAVSTENALLLDAGDATQGASFATVGSGAHVIDVMNAAGYDAMAAGNHEFDYGAEALLANAARADFPILSANVKKDGEALLQPSTVIETAGYRIGVVGITTASTATSTNPEKLEGITFENEIDSAKEQIAALEDQVDAIILVTHLGDNEAATGVTSEALLEALSMEELSKIAAVIDGHSHTVENKMYQTVPIVQAGTQNKNLGVVTIEFNENGNFAAEGNVWDYKTASEYPLTELGQVAQELTQAVLDQCVEDMDPELSEEIGRTGAPLWGGYIYYDYAEPRIVETTMGDLVTDAFRYYGEKFQENNGLSQPVIGLENGGGISATLPYGIVTRGDILNAFNHGNMVEVVKVTPAQLYTALEAGLVTTGQDETGLLLREKVSGSFLQVSGLTYTYDPAGEAGSKVTDVVLADGTALSREDTETELLAVTNSYVTTFAGLKEGQKLGELGGEDAIVQDYVLHLTNNGADTLTINRPAGRIEIANDKSPRVYEVVIPVKAADGSAYDFTGTEFEVVIDNDAQDIRKVTCQADGLHLTVGRGAHTFYLTESADNVPVYTNNYSGSGTVTTADGYYHLYFTVDPATVGAEG